jgi:restriction system protein
MHPRRVRFPRGWVGLVYVIVYPMLYLTWLMFGFMFWLMAAGTQVTCWGIADLSRFTYQAIQSRRNSPRMQAVSVHALADFQHMTPAQFEHALANLCWRDGCTAVQVVGGAGDLGADVIATTPDGRRMVIQAKRYQLGNNVGSPEVQKVGGTYAVVHRAHLAAVVTTSGFTQAAVGYAQQAGIRLFGARELAGWAARTGPAPWH